MAVLLLLAFTGCHGSASTETINGQFMGATPHQVMVQLDEPGMLSTQRSFALDPHLKVTRAGETVSIRQLPISAPIRVTRDIDSHLVTRIDAK